MTKSPLFSSAERVDPPFSTMISSQTSISEDSRTLDGPTHVGSTTVQALLGNGRQHDDQAVNKAMVTDINAADVHKGQVTASCQQVNEQLFIRGKPW